MEAHRNGDGEYDAFTSELVDKLEAKMSYKAGPPKKLILGLEASHWIKLVFGWAFAAIVFVLTWYNTVNSELASKPSAGQVEQLVDDGLEEHEERIKTLEQEQRVIRDSQIRQEAIDQQQTDTLREIRDDIKQMRRR